MPKENLLRTRKFVALAITAIAVVAVSACSTSTTSGPAPTSSASTPATASASTDRNAADVTFVQGMIPHHTQAVAMSQHAATRAATPQVKELAERIEKAQEPEIQQMNGLLKAWGEPEPSPGMGDMGGMSHSEMPGMMTDDQMSQLGTASGAPFDRMFLQMMIEHHKGAIAMSKTELDQGENAEAKELAQSIIASQQAELTEMNNLLAQT